MLWCGFGDSGLNHGDQFFPPDNGQQPDLPPESGQPDALGVALLTAPGAAVLAFLVEQHAGAAALPLTAPGAAALEQHALAQSEPHFLALA